MSGLQLQSMKLTSFEDETNDMRDDIQRQPQSKPKFGRLIVLRKEKPHLSIGPDWPFTICATVMFLGFAYGLSRFQLIITFGEIGIVVHYFFMMFPLCSFIFTVFSNPGIYDCYENDEPKIKYCETCRVFKPKKVYHCSTCNICIQGLDHHCPWVSKCIGKRNLTAFYVFISSVPLSFVYFIYLVISAMGPHTKP